MAGLEVTKDDVEKQEDQEKEGNLGEKAKDAVKGGGIIDDFTSLGADVSNQNWTSGLLDAAGIAGSVAQFAADPLAGLLSAGFGWAMEHVSFLKEPLDWLTGDQSAIKAASQTWGNVAKDLGEAGSQLSDTIKADAAPWHGPAIEAYVPAANMHAKLVSASSAGAQSASTVIEVCGQVLEVVRSVVRDLISQAVGDLVACLLEWAAAEVLSIGLATPGMVADVVRRAVEWVGKITPWVKKVTEVFKRAEELLKKLKPLLDRLKTTLKGPLEGLGETKLGKAVSKAHTPFKEGAEGGLSRSVRHTYAKAPGYDEAGNLVPSHSRIEWPRVDPDALGKETANSLAEEARKKAAEDYDKWVHSQNDKSEKKPE